MRSPQPILVLGMFLILVVPSAYLFGSNVSQGPNPIYPVAAMMSSSPSIPQLRASSGSPYVAYTLDLCNNTLVKGNYMPACAMTPIGAAYDSGKDEVFVANYGTNNVSVISGVTHRVTATIGVGSAPSSVAYDSGDGEVFVTNYNSNNVTVINDTSNKVVVNVPVGSQPQSAAYDGVKSEVFVADHGANYMSIITTSTNKVTNVPVGTGSAGLAYDSGKGEVFVTRQGANDVSVVSDTTNNVVTTVPVGTNPLGAVYDEGKGEVFVANDGSANVSVISDLTNRVSATVKVGSFPFGLAYDRVGGEIFATNYNSNNASVINDTSNKVVATVALGTNPSGIVYDPVNRHAIATNSGQDTVSFISILVVTSFTASPDPTDTGAVTAFAVSVSGGNAPYTYSYSGLPPGCVSSSTQSLTCTPTGGPGAYSVAALVSDSVGGSANSTLGLTVNAVVNITSFTASPNPLDLQNHTTITVSVSGGTTPYAYKYTGLPGGCTSSNTASLLCTPTVYGAFIIRVYVNDSAGTSHSKNLTLRINPPITISLFGATPNPTDIGIRTVLNVSTSGGTPPYAYTYTGLPVGCVTSDTSSLACAPQISGTFAVRVFVNDSVGRSANTTLSLLVNPPVTISSLAATPNPTDVGSLTKIAVSASGGTAPYAYSYAALPPGCTSSNTPSLQCTPSQPGNFTIRIFVNDSLGKSTNTSLLLAVHGRVMIASFTASPNPVDITGSTTLTVSVSGGTLPYNFRYTGLPTGCASYNTYSLLCTPTVTGTFAIRVFVNDSAGNSTSVPVILNIDSAVSISSFLAKFNPSDVGVATTLTVSALGGTTPYRYAYTGLPSGCVTSNNASLTCTPTASGNFTVRVFVNDSASMSRNATLPFTLHARVSITSFTASPKSIDINSSTTLSVSASGGTLPYAYTYAGLPAGCLSSNAPSLTCTPRVAGSFAISIFVNDSVGGSNSSMAVLTIAPAVSITSFTASPNPTDIGHPITFQVSSSGGIGPYTYVYTGLPAGCSTSSVASLPCTPVAVGIFAVHVFVNDSTGRSANATLALTEHADVTITSFAASPNPIYMRSATVLTVSALGGTAPYAYKYVGLPLGCTSADTISIQCAPATTGTFDIRVYVNDSVGSAGYSTTTLVVKAIPIPTIEAFAASPSRDFINSQTKITVNVSGGIGPLSYAYTGLPSGCRSANTTILPCVPTVVGNFSIRVYVNDTWGHSVTATTYLTVLSGNTSGTGGGFHLSAIWVLPFIALIAVLLAVLVILLLRRREGPHHKGATGEAGPSSAVSGHDIPPVAPQGYLDGVAVVPAEWDENSVETAEEAAYGTYSVSEVDSVRFVEELASRGHQERSSPETGKPVLTEKGLDSQQPWSLNITPGGIIVEEGAAAGAPKDGVHGSDIAAMQAGAKDGAERAPERVPAAPAIASEDAYRILQILARVPRSLEGIKQEVPLDDTALLALLTALTKAKLIASGASKDKGTIFILTSLGRRTGRRFTEGRPIASPDTKSLTTKPSGTKRTTSRRLLTRKRSSPASLMKTSEANPPAADKATEPKESLDTPENATLSPEHVTRGTHIEFEGTIGVERSEKNPFEGDIKPEDINPNVRHLDPRLLQPMEMRITQDPGSDVRAPSKEKDAADRARGLLERARQSRLKRKGKYGAEQAAPLTDKDEE